MGNTAMGDFLRRIARRLPSKLANGVPRRPLAFDGERSLLSARSLRSIQRGTLAYEYAGSRCLESPFDLALYMMLMSRQRPRTIVEIGSMYGGSAVWFAAQARALGLEAKVISLDINRVVDVLDPDVTFLQGDIHALSVSDLPGLLADCPRPLLVIEDGPHTFEGCFAAMEFFHDHMRPGEFLIIEDGILKDLRYWRLDDGPNRAIAAFRSKHPDEYRLADEYCHFFGHNVTWNTNGYLQRVR